MSETNSQPLVLSSPRKAPARYKLPWVNTFTDEVADRLCNEVAGGRTLERISIEEPWAPSVRKIHEWMTERPDFRAAYEMARIIRADLAVQEIINIADRAIDDVNIESSKLQIHARQWLAMKMAPRSYGDRKTIDTNVNAQISTTSQINVSHLTMEEVYAAERALNKMIDVKALPGGEEGPEDE
jgi:hypothetical protein